MNSKLVLLLLVVVVLVNLFAQAKITDKNRKKVTQQQNNIRSKVAKGKWVNGTTGTNLPKAKNMIKILWSKKVEKAAKKISKTCAFTPTQGVNMVALEGNVKTAAALKNATLIWSSELNSGNLSSLVYTAPVNRTSYSNFTQMIWAKTKLFGCGINRCTNISGISSNATTLTFVVCKYKAAGNVEGENIYKKGKKLKCPKKTHKAPSKQYCKQNSKTKAGWLAVGK